MSSVSASAGSAGLPIDQLISTGKASSTASTSTGSSAQLGENEFLQLLTTQLQNQDPLNPMDDTQSIAELAQFSGLQAMTQLKDSFSSFQSSFAVMQSAGLIGKTVSAQTTDASGNASTVQGTVKAIEVVNGQPQFTLVDSSGKLLTDGNGQTLVLPTTAILTVG